MNYIIYKLTCVTSEKAYVGYTSRTLDWRWKRHVHGAIINAKKSAKQLLAIAIRKHGTTNWTREILERVETKEQALNAERRLIAEHKTYFKEHPETGYNMTPGGEWGLGHPKGVKLTPLHRKHIGDSCRGLKRPDDAIQRTAEAHRGMKRSAQTREKIRIARAKQVCSEETRRKMSKTRKGRKVDQECIAKRKVTRARQRFQRLSYHWFMKS